MEISFDIIFYLSSDPCPQYGEVGKYYGRAEDALSKQQHRLMWERRHGPIGTGMKKEE